MYFEAKLVVINNYLARFEDKWHSFKENGADYVDKISGLMKDLDIVGNNSLLDVYKRQGHGHMKHLFHIGCHLIKVLVYTILLHGEVNGVERFI